MKISCSSLTLARMEIVDLDDVMAIENAAYTHPWSKGSFMDSLAQHHDAWVVRSVDEVVLGYFVQMPVFDEAHLLTIAVREDAQGQGIGQFLLQHAICRAKSINMIAISLEVRVSNFRALTLYGKVGFVATGRRKNYYKVAELATGIQREDALILRYEILW